MKEEYKDFVGIYDKSIPVELCNTFVEWFEWCSTNNLTIGSTLSGKPPDTDDDGVASIMREDESLHYPGRATKDKTLTSVYHKSLPYSLCNEYHQNLQKCFLTYTQKYQIMYMSLASYTFKIHKVRPGQGYHVWHCENDHTAQGDKRVLAWMTYLRVPEEGGETEFLYQSRRIEPVVGKTLIWPAYFTHMHRGNPPLKGEKYYITGWFERE